MISRSVVIATTGCSGLAPIPLASGMLGGPPGIGAAVKIIILRRGTKDGVSYDSTAVDKWPRLLHVHMARKLPKSQKMSMRSGAFGHIMMPFHARLAAQQAHVERVFTKLARWLRS